MKTLGDKLKAIRTSKGWTQEDIAHDLDISLTSYSKIERDVTDINLSRIIQLSKIFKMTISDIFNYGDENIQSGKFEIENFKKLVDEKDKEIMSLQKKIINLFEKNGMSPAYADLIEFSDGKIIKKDPKKVLDGEVLKVKFNMTFDEAMESLSKVKLKKKK